MHLHRIGTVMVSDVLCRNPFPKIRLKAVHSHIEKFFQFFLVPLAGHRICKVHQRHSRLPHIPLPHIPVFPPDQISLIHSLLKQTGFLCNIGIDPDTDFQPLRSDSGKHSLRVWKYSTVPYKVTPMEFLHPETVKMENLQWYSTFLHPINKAHDCLLIIVCGKGC